MKVAVSLSDRKLEVAQWLFALENEEMFAQVEDLIPVLVSEAQAQDDIPQSHLDSTARGDADTEAGRVITLDAFRAKYARCGI